MPLLIGLAISFILEPILLSNALPAWRRPWAANVLHLCGYLLIFCFELLLFQRPWFAAIIACSFFILLIVISNTKQAMLREPFIYQDFEYFVDLIKHPRLYIPFFGIGKTIAGVALFSVLIYSGIVLESSLLITMSLIQFVGLYFALLGLACSGLILASRYRLVLSFNPVRDLMQYGLFGSLISYRWAENQAITVNNKDIKSLAPAVTISPHLLVIQSESFFDIRRMMPQIRTEILSTFDAYCAEAAYSGRLKVPAWGANTVRTEFAFLSGRSPESLGVHQFNPYRRFAAENPDSIALRMRAQGYKTICIHPYPASFYRRDKIYPLLGFDEFIDIAAFDAPQDMPYVADVAVAKKVDELLATANEPLFILVITMENHGPLHLERVNATDFAELFLSPNPVFCDELTIYLRHLRNANQMLVDLKASLNCLARPTVMAWYGDHVPIIPALYQQIGEPDGMTDYFIWTNQKSLGQNSIDLHAEQLTEYIALVLAAHREH